MSLVEKGSYYRNFGQKYHYLILIKCNHIRMALTEAVLSGQFSFEDWAGCILGKLLGLRLVTLGSARLGRKGTRWALMTSSRGVEAMVLAVAWASGSELIELLSSPLQGNPQGRHLAADCHIKFRSKYASKCTQISLCTISGVFKNHLHLQGCFEMLEIDFSLPELIDKLG